MNAGRQIFFEVGLFAFFLLAPLSFGAVYPWGYMSLAALLFFLFIFSPDPFTAVLRLPRFFSIGFSLIFLGLAVQFLFSSVSRYVTGIEILKWLACACGFVLVQGLEKRSVYFLMGFFIFLGAAESLYGTFEVVSGREHVLWQAKEAYQGFATGTYINRNHLAGLLEMSLGVSFGFLVASLLDPQKAWHFIGYGFLFIVIMMGLLKTGSRMGLVSAFSVLFIFSLLFLLRFQRTLVFWLFGGWMIFLTGVALLFGKRIFIARFTDFVSWSESLSGRLSPWQDAVKIIRDHPWLGTGLGTYEWIFPIYQSVRILLGMEHAHNDYLELAVELGIPLFILLIFCFVSLWIYCLKKLFVVFERFSFSAACGSLAGASILAVHSLADFNLAIPANHYLFILLLGMTLRLLQCEEEFVK